MWKPAIVIVTAFVLLATVRAVVFFRQDMSAKPRLITDADSPFFRAYNPGKMIVSFYIPNLPCKSAFSKSGGEEGPRDLNFETICVIKTDSEERFVEALHAELLSTLNAAHATVTKEEEHGVGGYRCTYRSGKSTGAVAVEPLERLLAQEEKELPSGLEKVRLRLRVNEEPHKWWW